MNKSEYIREKLKVRFLIRMTETEKKELEIKSEKLNISQAECLRKSIREIPIADKKESDFKGVLSKDEYFLLLNIANNLNQNTKFANVHKMISDKLVETIDRVMQFVELKS
ncbi:hypothetical protein [Flavobacterium sp. GNP002]